MSEESTVYIAQRGKRFREHQPFVLVVTAFALGIGLDAMCWKSSEIEVFLTTPVLFWFGIMAFAGVLWRSLRFLERQELSGTLTSAAGIRVAVLLCGIAAAGGAWHHLYWNVFPRNEVSRTFPADGTLALVEGVVLRPLERFYANDEMLAFRNEEERNTVLELRVLRMKNRQTWVEARGRLAVRIQGDLQGIHPGDTVTVSGKLLHPTGAKNPGGFSPAEYYRTRRILAILRVPSPENVQRTHRPVVWGLYRLVEYLRDTARSRLETFLPPQEKGLADAVVLGCRDEISQLENDTMLETGTVHLMSVSGLHVGLLAAGILLFLRLLPLSRAWKTGILLAMILLYVMITGARPPAVRAGMLVTVASLAFSLGRQSSRQNALSLAALVVLGMNPTTLFNTGTQLSFLAVGALVYTPLFRPRRTHFDEDESWEYWFADRSRRGRILRSMARYYGLALWNLLYSSLVLTLVLIPLVAWRFHIVAPIGILMNLLLGIPLTVALLTCAMVILFGWIPGVGWTLGTVCAFSLSTMKGLIFAGAEVPGHCFWTAGPTVGWVLAFYGILVGWFLYSPFFTRKKRLALVLAGVTLVLIFLPQWLERPRDFLRCSFISVSHGLAVLLELPDGRNFLFDAGQFSSAEYPQRTISEYLWYRGIRRLDAIFISHPDLDHYNAVPGLLERFPVDTIYVSPFVLKRQEKRPTSLESTRLETDSSADFYAMRKLREAPTDEMLDQLFQAIQQQGVPIQPLVRGDLIPLSDEGFLHVLHPPPDFSEENSNANSLVLHLQYGTFSLFLTGDLGPPATKELLNLAAPPCTVLQAPHHGGRTCNTAPFARWCRPQYVVLSETSSDTQNETTELFQKQGATVFHTGLQGAVIFTFRDGTLSVQTGPDEKKQ